MSNVIKFPKTNKNKLPSLDEVKENIEIQKVSQIAEVSGVVADTAIETLMQCGYDFPIGTRAEIKTQCCCAYTVVLFINRQAMKAR